MVGVVVVVVYVVGQMIAVSTNAYLIDSIERNTNEACTGGLLHSVHLVNVVTGERSYMYATTEQIAPEPDIGAEVNRRMAALGDAIKDRAIPDPGGLAREVMMRSE